MSNIGDVDWRHLQELLRPADSILALGLAALSRETLDNLQQRWQELETSWQAYETQFLGKLPPAADQDFRSTVTLARLLIVLSLQEQGQTIPSITGFFSVKEVYLGRLLAGAEALEVFTPEELKKESIRSPNLRQLLADLAEHQQQGIAGLLDPGSQLRKDLVAAFKSKYAARLAKLEELARLYHAQLIDDKIIKDGPGAVLQPAETQQTLQTPRTQPTQSAPPTINITGNVDGPIIIKQEIKAEAEQNKGQDITKQTARQEGKRGHSFFAWLFRR